MAEFAKMVLTHDGLALQGKAQAGASLPFTRVAIGDGTLPEGTHLQELTGLVHEIESLDITELTNLGVGKVKLQARVTNEGRTEGFYIREIGIFANDPDVGEILYAVTNAGDRADYIPEEGGGIIEEVLNLITIIGNAEHVTAVIDSASAATVLQVQELDARVTVLEADLAKDAAPIPYHIHRGQNIVDAVQDTGVSLLSIKGRTDINHVPLFDSGLWSLHANAVMDSPTKITLNATATHQHTTIQVACKPSTTYTISLLHSGYYNLANVDDNDGVTPISNYRTDSTYTFTTAANAVKIRLQLTSGTVGTGTYTFENIMLAEGSHPRPFVANMKPLGAVMIENKGKNLLPPASQATTSSFVTVTGEYAVRIDGNNSAQSASFSIGAAPGQTYTLSVDHDGYLLVIEYDKNGAEVARPVDYQQGPSYTFTTNANTARMQVFLHSNSIAQVFMFSNWMLNLGAEPLPFEPQYISRMFIPEVGRSSADGTVCDEVYERDGKLFRMQKFGYQALDGSLAWAHSGISEGFRRVYTKNPGMIEGVWTRVLIKYDGTVIDRAGVASEPDRFSMSSDGENLLLSLSNSDTGWSDSYTPTADEIKAYFYGWKMFSATSGNSPYDSGTKAWYPIGNVHGQHSVTSVPLYQAGTTRPGRWQPYQLQYQLAQPVEVEIADIGGLSLHIGLNQVELSEGVILGEPVTPVRAPNGNHQINNVLFPYSQLKNRAGRIVKIYRDGREDTDNWVIRVPPDDVNNAFGISLAYTTESQYDPTATYSVDYIALDKYLLTTNADEVDLEGQANLATAVGKNVRDIADVKRDVTVIERDYARKQQPGWIIPTLLNGWVHYGAGRNSLAYTKDEFGFVHVRGTVKGGVVGSNMFQFPEGYRPSGRVTLPTRGFISDRVIGSVVIYSGGTVNVYDTGNTEVDIFISFRAEQ